MNRRTPQNLASPPDAGTPGYVVAPTVCQYCIVGCGYEAHVWQGQGKDGPPPLKQGIWVSPAMTGQIRSGGDPATAAVLPDPKCPMNRGNHSPRGGTQGRNLVFSA